MELSHALASDNNVSNHPHTTDSFFRSCFSTKQDILYHLKNRKIHYWVHNSLPLEPILCQMYWTTNSKPVPYVPMYKWSLPLQVCNEPDFYRLLAIHVQNPILLSCCSNHFKQCVPIRNTMQLLQHTRHFIIHFSATCPTFKLDDHQDCLFNYYPPYLVTISCIHSLRTSHFNDTECNCSFTSHL